MEGGVNKAGFKRIQKNSGELDVQMHSDVNKKAVNQLKDSKNSVKSEEAKFGSLETEESKPDSSNDYTDILHELMNLREEQ